MRLHKNTRGAEKRAPAMSLLVATPAFIAVFLVALWVMSGPSDKGPGYKSSVSQSTVEDTMEGRTSNLPKAGKEVDVSAGSQTNEELLLEALRESEESDEPLPKSDKSEEDALTQFEKSEETLREPEQSEDTDMGFGNPGEDDKLDESTMVEEEEKQAQPESNADGDEAPEESTVEKTAAGDKAELLIEIKNSSSSSLLTQGKESKEEKIQEIIQDAGTVEEKDIVDEQPMEEPETEEERKASLDGLERVEVSDNGTYTWKICSWDDAQDYIPCLDNTMAIKQLKSTKHFEHRERHCPVRKDLHTCLVPLPEGYQTRVDWPESRDKIWHSNVPHDKLVSYKKDQNWVKKTGNYLLFPGGGTQFKNGALQYINTIHKTWTDITWGKHVRTVLDVGCGVASFGGYMFEKDALTMSFAPKDEHEAQVQMALERGIPGILSVMGTKRLTFPSNVFDVIHCARCRVPWHGDALNMGTGDGGRNNKGGKLLLELNRLLRPGGYFVWSATPVYRLKDPEEVEIWKATKEVTDAICWKLLVRTKADPDTQIGMAIFQKPENNSCYDRRKIDEPPMCPVDDKADAAWYVDMNSCIHRIPSGDGVRATEWPVNWPVRLEATPKWLSSVPKGIYGQPASEEFVSDTKHWESVAKNSYFTGLGIDWKHIRNVMDMNAGYGGFSAALSRQPLWVMNVVPTDEPDTLPIIYDRGLFGLYHDWCESFSTYPRTYDFLHANHVLASVKERCSILITLVEMDRILRPEGWAIFRDTEVLIGEVEEIVKSLHWVVKYSYVEGTQRLLAAQKGMWRPEALA